MIYFSFCLPRPITFARKCICIRAWSSKCGRAVRAVPGQSERLYGLLELLTINFHFRVIYTFYYIC